MAIVTGVRKIGLCCDLFGKAVCTADMKHSSAECSTLHTSRRGSAPASRSTKITHMHQTLCSGLASLLVFTETQRHTTDPLIYISEFSPWIDFMDSNWLFRAEPCVNQDFKGKEPSSRVRVLIPLCFVPARPRVSARCTLFRRLSAKLCHLGFTGKHSQQ